MSTKPMRRAKGSGSVRQRGKASWEIRYDSPPDANGKSEKIHETVQGTRRDAEKALRVRLTAVETGNYVAKTQETVGQFMLRWLDTYVATNTTPRTQQGYRGNVTRYITPAIGNIALQKLRPHHIQQIYADMLGRDLSARTVLHVHRVLREALGHAVQWGSLTRNPTDATTPPRPQRRELEMWDTDTIHAFLNAAQGSPHLDFYHLAVLTGMRRGELCGLKWESIDLASGRLMVVRTMQRIYGKGLLEGQPKTSKSRRSIALSQDTVKLLHERRGTQIEHRLNAGPAWQNTGYVFTQSDGRPVDPDALTHDFQAIVRKRGLPHLTLHGLRHAHATLLLTAGIHPKVVSERLGHSNIAITMDIYSHVLPDMQEAAARAVDERLAQRGLG